MKHKINHCLYIGVFLILFSVKAQSPESYFNNLSLPSPAAFEMTRYDAQQPNLYTGTASVNIPVYTINFDGFQLPISLSYHSSGIRVNQEATEVGLGWSLNATGVISRVVKSGDDLLGSSYINSPTSYRKGYVFDNRDILEIAKTYWTVDENERIANQELFRDHFIDAEPDRFNYNFFGYSGSFVLGKKELGEIPIIKISVDPVSIKFLESSSTEDPLTFVITTPEGFKGFFSVKEYTSSLSSNIPVTGFPLPESQEYYATDLSTGVIDISEQKRKGVFQNITAWYLERIESPYGKTLEFSYDLRADGLSDYVSVGMPSFNENDQATHDNKPIGFNKQVVEHVYLDKITLEDELLINFQKDKRDDLNRLDLPFIVTSFDQNGTITWPQKYSKITIEGLRSDSEFVKNIDFHHSYFNEDVSVYNTKPFEKFQKLRLRLDGISIDDQKHEFGYYQGKKGLPNKSSLGMDHQGFYNGNDHLKTLNPVSVAFPFNGLQIFENFHSGSNDKRYYSFINARLPKLEYGIAGALESVRYPTGGITKYLYSLHDFYAEGADGIDVFNKPSYFAPAKNSQGHAGNVQYGGLRIREIQSYDNDGELITKKRYSFNTGSSTSTGVLINPIYYVSFKGNNPIPNSDNVSFISKASNVPGKNTAQGSEIGYSRVVETSWANDGTNYSSVHDFKNFPSNHLTYQTNDTPYLENLDHLNGKINSITSFDSENSPTNTYEVDAINTQEFGILEAVGYNILNFGPDGVPIFNLYALPITHAKPSQVTKTNTLANGDISTVETYDYDNFGQLKSSATINSKGKGVSSSTYRIKDYNDACGPVVQQKCMRDWLKDPINWDTDRNMVSAPLEQVSKVSDKVISAIAYRYGVEHNRVVLKEIFRYNEAKGNYVKSSDGFTFEGGYESVITFNYNTNGKLIEQILTDGITQSFIWDNTNTYPLVKGVNIGFDDLNTAYFASLGANFETDFRNHPLAKNAQISTFKADPLIGLDKMVNPMAIAQSFSYDSNERLKNIKDLDNHLLTEYQYDYGDYSKYGGLQASSSFNFGIVEPGNKKTEDITIRNTSNYGVTISNVTSSNGTLFKPNHSFWTPVYLPPNDQFNIKVTYSPTSVNQHSAVLTVESNDLNDDPLTVNLSGDSFNFNPQMNIPETCIVFEKNNDPFNTLQIEQRSVRIENLGNGPVNFKELVTNDDHISISGFSPKKRYDEDGELYFEPYLIEAYSAIIVDITLVSFDSNISNSNNNGNSSGDGDWDGDATVTIIGHNDADFVGNPEINFYWDSSPSPSPCADPPPSGPAFGVIGDIIAQCPTDLDPEMNGSITINYGEIRIKNETNTISGPNFIGATITVAGIGTIAPGQSLDVSPTSFPMTYNFTSTTTNCANGYGNSRLKVEVK